MLTAWLGRTYRSLAGKAAKDPNAEVQPRWLEVYFREQLAPMIYERRLPIVALTSVLSVGAAFIALSIPLPTHGIQIFPPRIMFRGYRDVQDAVKFHKAPKDFSFLNAQFAFGVVAQDNGDYNTPSPKGDLGTLQFDPTFSLKPLAAQTFLLAFARAAKKQPFVQQPSKGKPQQKTFIEELDKWAKTPFVPGRPSECYSAAGLPLAEKVFDGCLNAFSRAAYQQLCGRFNNKAPKVSGARPPCEATAACVAECRKQHSLPLIFQKDRLVAAFVSFKTNTKIGLKYSWVYNDIRKNWDQWQAFLKAQQALAPPSIKTVWFDNLVFEANDAQHAMALSCVQSGCIALLISFLVLVWNTRDVLVSLLSVFCILCILCTTTAYFVLIGWELGMLESVCIAILIGVSVDFVVHFSHSFCHASGSRLERVRHTLFEMGISVWSAAITTFLAAMCLQLCTITFFSQFGSFLMAAMVRDVLVLASAAGAGAASAAPRAGGVPRARDADSFLVGLRALPLRRAHDGAPSPFVPWI